MIQVPHTYSEWVEILTKLKNRVDDKEVFEAMQKGTVEWQSGVAERFSKKLIETVNLRMNTALDKFQTDMNRARGQEGAIVQGILDLRRELVFLAQAINLPALPDEEREQYRKFVTDQADKIQKSLEDSARNDRTGKLSSIVRNHRVNSF